MENGETTTWEISFDVTVTLERGGENNEPTVGESMALERALQDVLEAAQIDDLNDWSVYDWSVSSS